MNLIPGRLAIALGFSTAAHVGIVWMAGESLPSTAVPAQRALTVSMTPAAPRAILNSIAPAAAAAVAPPVVRPSEPERIGVIDEPDRVVSARASESVEVLDATEVITREPEHTLQARDVPSSFVAVAVVKQAEMTLTKAAQRNVVEKPPPSQLEPLPASPANAKPEPQPEPRMRQAAARASARERPRDGQERDPGSDARSQASVAGRPGADRNALPAAGNEPPHYPWTARVQGHQGRVVLSVWVSADGEAERLAVLQTSGYPALDRAAVDAVARWRFQPARRGGDETGSTLYVPVVFRLDD